jgi:5'-nucleotidase, C-terminal domain
VRGELDGVIAALETHTAAGPSFLEGTLTVVNGGVPVADDPAELGDLYYKVLGHTGFDVVGLRGLKVGLQSGETNGLNLDTDAMWAVANDFLVTTTTDIAVQASGPVRGDLVMGKTGDLSFADIYSVVPLGGDPVDGTPGYPLLRFSLQAVEVWAAFEYTLLAATQDSDFYLSPAGLEIVFDRTRTPFDPVTKSGGWITSMTLVNRAGQREPIFCWSRW